ncbi:MAG: hypothetical protein D3905_01815 [Candidatus Electrothrix sp. AS4_5]|nr:hypothetical protein [Candidatus Electrothrix gigas]
MFFFRCAKTVIFLLILLIGYGLTLLPLGLVWPHVALQHLVPALIAWAMLYLLPFPLFLGWILRHTWFFRGRGEPVSQDELEARLLQVNNFNTPVQVRKKKNAMFLSWRCDDPAWCQRMFIAGLEKKYELHLQFCFENKTVIMRDRVQQVDFSLCPLKMTSGLMHSVRFYARIRTKPKWQLNFLEKTEPFDYEFHPQEIKSPVVNTVLENGWNVRLSLW